MVGEAAWPSTSNHGTCQNVTASSQKRRVFSRLDPEAEMTDFEPDCIHTALGLLGLLGRHFCRLTTITSHCCFGNACTIPVGHEHRQGSWCKPYLWNVRVYEAHAKFEVVSSLRSGMQGSLRAKAQAVAPKGEKIRSASKFRLRATTVTKGNE